MPIDLHRFIVFCHVAGTVGMFAAVTIEWISVRSLLQATTYEEARQGMALWPLRQRIGLPSFLLVLASGIYLATSLDVWKSAWVAVALPTLVIVAVAGAVINPRFGRMRVATATGIGPLRSDAQLKVHDPMIVTSWRFRTALLSGLVLEMAAKPDYAGVLIIIVAGVIGIAWGALPWTTGGLTTAAASNPTPDSTQNASPKQ
jgi:hypothetical protein